MTSRERLLKTLNHQEPDRIPYDLGSTHLTGITSKAYKNLLSYSGEPAEETQWTDVIQQLALPSEKILDQFQVDTRGLFPLTSHNWDVHSKLIDTGKDWHYQDEWGITHSFPRENGNWFSIIKSPLSDVDFSEEKINNHTWPDAGNIERIKNLKLQAEKFRNQGKAVVLKGICAGLFEMAQRLRGMENAMMDLFLYPKETERLIAKLTDIKIEFWEMALNELHDVVDVVVEADDYGSQTSQLISPDQFRQFFKPELSRIFSFIKNKAPNTFLFFHSCGNVRPIIPDFIEIGVDILNPVHITAEGMEPVRLKKDFGKDITFWGGGIETQNVLPNATPQEIEDNIRSNIDALAPGGGFVFNTIHNIQAEVPPQNIIAMVEALQKYGKY